VIIKANQCNKNIDKNILAKLKKSIEGKCTHHGYIKHNSVKVISKSAGKIQSMTFNGDVLYDITFSAELCNPEINSTIKCVVVNFNNFGILAECSLDIDGEKVPVIEALVVKQPGETYDVNIGDKIIVKIKGKKYELNDKKITVHGKLVNEKENLKNKDGLDDVKGEEDIIDEENEDEESHNSDDENNDDKNSEDAIEDDEDDEEDDDDDDNEEELIEDIEEDIDEGSSSSDDDD